MRLTFRTQLTITIALIILATIFFIGLLANVFINLEFEQYKKEQQKAYATAMVTSIGAQYNSQKEEWNKEYIHGMGMSALFDGYVIRLEDANGVDVWDAENHDMVACSEVMMDIISRMEQRRPGLDGGFVSQQYEVTQNDQTIGNLSIRYFSPYFFSEKDFQFLDSLNAVLVAIGAVALLCSLVVGGLLAKRISKPVIKMAHIATEIADGNYAIRFDGESNINELDKLVTSVNYMASSLEKQEGLRKRLTTDVAHELRTPLTAVSSHLEAMIEGVWKPTPERLGSCFEEIGRISGLISDLERLARVENENLNLEKADVNLLSLASSVASNFERESVKKNISILVEGTESHVNADKDRLNQVLTNLISNAVKYSAESCKIIVKVTENEQNGLLIVEDNGIGIPEKDLPFIFERFYRTDQSRSRLTGGAGIGLAIVKSIVTAHGGTVTVESSEGSGSRFTIALPQ